MGGTVVRTYVLSVRRTNDSPDVPRHVLGPGQFNEEAFRALDQVLQVANEQGVRLIIPFVDNWHWWGGRAQYAGFRGKTQGRFLDRPAAHRRLQGNHSVRPHAHQHPHRRAVCG